jgi:hypothetical protein
MTLLVFRSLIRKFSRHSKVAKEELDAYLKRGALIRKYKPERYSRLENLIEKNEDSEIVLNAKEEYTNHRNSFGSSFITFSAPRMTGKTQMAFTIDSKLPLYLVGNSKGESIYQNFTKLSHRLIQSAGKDYFDIYKQHSLKDSYVATVEILDCADKLKLRSLGLLKALIAEAKNTFNGFENISLTDWMKFLSKTKPTAGSNIPVLSIQEFLQDPDFQAVIDKFYMFIDEFSAEKELVLLKNLCRVIGMTCVVASTDSKLTNLFKASPFTLSQIKNPSIWTVVVPSLPLVPKEMIVEDIKLNESLDRLNAMFKPKYSFRMEKMAKFILDQCENSRPGISNIISNFVTNYTATNEFNIDDFFTDLVLNVSSEIKKRIITKTQGRMSNVSLILGKQFDSSYDLDYEYLSVNDSSEMESHLYYLKDPYYHNSYSYNDTFALFQGSKTIPGATPRLYICADLYIKPIVYVPQCYFNSEEKILLLACLIGEMEGSIASQVSKLTFHNVKTSVNLKTKYVSEFKFEDVICASLIDSSHYSQENPLGTFKGVALGDFIINLIANFDETSVVSRSTRRKIHLQHSHPEMDHWLKSIKVPFLNCANFAIDYVYEYIFPQSESKIKFGKFTRPVNSAEIDDDYDMWDEKNEKTFFREFTNWENLRADFERYDRHLKADERKKDNAKCQVHFNFWPRINNVKHSSGIDAVFDMFDENNSESLAIIECKNWNDTPTESSLYQSLLKAAKAKQENDNFRSTSISGVKLMISNAWNLEIFVN